MTYGTRTEQVSAVRVYESPQVHLDIFVIDKYLVLSFFTQEFRKIYGQFFPCGDPTKFVDYIFNVFDEDKVRN